MTAKPRVERCASLNACLGRFLIEGDVAEGDAVVMEGVQSVRAGVALRRLDAENPAIGVGD